ncbi:hypothetical protein CFOL_v3_30307 [Cephalotus follicularis]|uniref:Uncharacterized protein n=1 Tax=Cephalotus follicularis TaxID=3775 RepID=A0A1Q3D391_CEPFO|nr:hypothetical protein CFOL_v3_30307 [Cephalotus follicularis]
MADLLRRAERYVNAEEEMAARKKKMPWSGHQEEKGGHSRNAPKRREKRKERTCPRKTLDINSPDEKAYPEEGHQSRPITTSPPSWKNAPEYLLWNKTRSPSSGQRS